MLKYSPEPSRMGLSMGGWRVRGALEQSLEEAVHQEHGRPQTALVASPQAWLPKGRGWRRDEQCLGLGALLPLPVLAAILVVSLFPIFLWSLRRKRVQNSGDLLRHPSTQMSSG